MRELFGTQMDPFVTPARPAELTGAARQKAVALLQGLQTEAVMALACCRPLAKMRRAMSKNYAGASHPSRLRVCASVDCLLPGTRPPMQMAPDRAKNPLRVPSGGMILLITHRIMILMNVPFWS
jgi:hypothetical protein